MFGKTQCWWVEVGGRIIHVADTSGENVAPNAMEEKTNTDLASGISSAMFLLCNIGKVFLHFPSVTSSVNNYIR